MTKLVKNMFLKVAGQFTKDRFLDVEVNKNPFEHNADLSNNQK